MNNYEFCASYVKSLAPCVALDYGCGSGGTVQLLTSEAHDVTVYGCDVYYEGHSPEYLDSIPADLRRAGVIREMKDDRIPFDDGSFDVVVNNQVMEHVEDLDTVLAEIARVLKPGGVVLSIFPDRSVWREGHAGIPFLHRIRNRRIRLWYAVACRSLGMGRVKGTKSRIAWSRDFCTWLDDWTRYRSYDEISAAYRRHLGRPEHCEPEWLAKRLGRRLPLPRGLQSFIVRKGMGMVFTARTSAED